MPALSIEVHLVGFHSAKRVVNSPAQARDQGEQVLGQALWATADAVNYRTVMLQRGPETWNIRGIVLAIGVHSQCVVEFQLSGARKASIQSRVVAWLLQPQNLRTCPTCRCCGAVGRAVVYDNDAGVCPGAGNHIGNGTDLVERRNQDCESRSSHVR